MADTVSHTFKGDHETAGPFEAQPDERRQSAADTLADIHNRHDKFPNLKLVNFLETDPTSKRWFTAQ
jgi:hypothetical protein